jgi:hypothetical protein
MRPLYRTCFNLTHEGLHQTIGSKALAQASDAYSVMGLRPSRKYFACFEGFIFAA